jgi:hypothetical protein
MGRTSRAAGAFFAISAIITAMVGRIVRTPAKLGAFDYQIVFICCGAEHHLAARAQKLCG